MEPQSAYGILVYNSFGPADVAVLIAAGKAGAVGILDLERVSDADEALRAVAALALGGRRWGLRLDASNGDFADAVLAGLPAAPKVLVLANAGRTPAAQVERARAARGCTVLLEVLCGRAIPAAIDAAPDGLVLKGNEAGGRVGGETSFILLQDTRRRTAMPLWVHGGIGLHTAAAAYAGGAAGVVLDHQLALTAESRPPEAVRATLLRMDGSETQCRTLPGGEVQRAYFRPGRTGGDNGLWPLGQDAALAAPLAARFHTTGSIVEAFRVSVEDHLQTARRLRPLEPGGGMARSHGTRYPVVQGPMTRVSDNAGFAFAVATGGGLPFLALALMRAPEIRKLLEETRAQLGAQPWGVGILGFVPDTLRREQLEVVREFRPAYALIAGGRPDQAEGLEREGIKTYLHVPSPGLLRQFLEGGARRFVFEGRECGGHVGPRSSFVLWNAAIDTVLEHLPPAEIAGCHFLFAGGIHDATSAAAVAAAAAPLAAHGARIGVLLGTAYLFTREAVESGAIVRGFQEEALRCRETVLLETGPGHATRCAQTAYADEFLRRKESLAQTSAEEVRGALEDMNLGRLRIASKGVRRAAAPAAERALEAVDESGQRSEGMYMIGQVAALRDSICTIEDLHRDVCVGGTERLAKLVVPRLSRASRRARPEPCDVAIVGMACLFPKAAGLHAYWNNILGKVDAITEIPASRWDWRRYYDADPKAPDKIYSKWGGFLDDVPFDPLRYGMPPNSLPSIEPLQLLTLEVARAALDDAGYGARPFARDRCSVILGAGGGMSDLGNRYAVRSSLPTLMDGLPGEVYGSLPQWTEDSFAGILLNVAAGRVANRLDLGGMNCTLDAACASSLGALYVASKELESGTSDMVLAGGADTMQNPFAYLCFSKTQALSPRGRCRTFDESADGIVISEGVAVVVLKRLADAEADGDRIYAVLKSVGTSSDGQDKGLTAPRPEGQASALRRAYDKAGFSPASVGLIEAHGTGTVAGDRAEVEALTKVFGEFGARPRGCAIGSVKSMIGHTKCTAGVAGLLKVALALHDKVLPPTLHVQRPNAKALLPDGPFYVSAEARPWTAPIEGHPRRAGVSAFGFGGTNFHAVLEEYVDPGAGAAENPVRHWPHEIFAWAAETSAELRAAVAEMEQFLQSGREASLGELAFAVWCKSAETLGRCAAPARLVVFASSTEELADKLRRAIGAPGESAGVYFASEPPAEGHKTAVLFPGQGSQRPGMLADLAIHFEEVRRRFEIADRVLAEHLPGGLSALVFPPPSFTPQETAAHEEALRRTEIAQPALGAADLGCLRLLEAFGVAVDCAAGHSYGEFVALCAAGAFGEEELYRLSEERGRAIAENATEGVMAAAHESAQRAATLIDGLPGVWIANRNAPRQTVLSGTKAGVEQAVALLERNGIAAQRLNVACAFHTPLVAAAQQRLEQAIGELPVRTLAFPVYSNQSGDVYPSDADAVRSRLAAHLTQPVCFEDEVRAMWRDGVRVFVEAGPRGVLTGLVDQILEDQPHLAVSMGGDFNEVLARLFVQHVPVRFDRLFRGRALRRIDLADTKSAQAATSKALWLVNGSRARPMAGSDAVIEPVRVQAYAPAAEPRPTLVAAPVSALPGEAEHIMLRYQETMAQMIETERQIMLAYLEAGSVQAVPSAAPQIVAPTLPVEAPALAAPAVPPVAPAPAISDAIAEPLSRESLTQKLLLLVSERTGYPPDMLGLDQDIEADLGIDSIKRVEILGAFRKIAVPVGADPSGAGMEKLAGLKTLRQVTEAVFAMIQGPKAAEPSPEPALEALPRHAIAFVETAALPLPEALPRGTILITDDEGGVARALADAVRARGGTPVVLRAADLRDPEAIAALVARVAREQEINGIVHLLPLRPGAPFESLDGDGWRTRVEENVTSLFHLVRGVSTRRPFLMAATNFGRGCPSHGGVSGLVKTIAAEWKDVRVRVVDLSDEAPQVGAERLLAELAAADAEIEVAYREGRRNKVRLVPAETAGRVPAEVAPGSVMLITGGARGITARVAIELARKHRPTLVIVGRTAIPDGVAADEFERLTTMDELRAAVIERARGEGASVAAIEARVSQILRVREIRENLARMTQAGAQVQYLATDVRDEAAFSRLLDAVYAQHGRIDYAIHGAGVIEDKLLQDKTPESFRRVLETKAVSAFVLSRKLRPESLKSLVLFSSIAGRFGNAGQGDYAAANEVLNKFACCLDGRWPCRVVALNWGPWGEMGMASPAIQQRFAERSIGVIPPGAGCAALDRELRLGIKGEAEIVLGSVPVAHAARGLPLLENETLAVAGNGSIECTYRLSANRLLLLNDHRLDGKPVLPAAVAAELMAELAQKAYPDWRVVAVRSLRVLKGIVLDGDERLLRLSARPQTQPSHEASQLDVDVEIHDSGIVGRPHYRATVRLALALPAMEAAPELPAASEAQLTARDVYRDYLFHGPGMQCIEAIESVSRQGIVCALRRITPAAGNWLLDPVMLDAGPQLAIVWSRVYQGATALPSAFAEYRVLAEPDGAPLRCYLKIRADSSDACLRADVYFVRSDGRLAGVLECLEAIPNAALNRLAAYSAVAGEVRH